MKIFNHGCGIKIWKVSLGAIIWYSTSILFNCELLLIFEGNCGITSTPWCLFLGPHKNQVDFYDSSPLRDFSVCHCYCDIRNTSYPTEFLSPVVEHRLFNQARIAPTIVAQCWRIVTSGILWWIVSCFSEFRPGNRLFHYFILWNHWR